MGPFHWMPLFLILTLGKCEPSEEHVQHQNTRFFVVGRPYFARRNGDQKIQVSSTGRLYYGSRPLFSWDAPSEEPPEISGNVSEIKPSFWHGPRRPMTYFKTAKPAHIPKPQNENVFHRKSYVYEGVPKEETTPAPSKRIMYVVSRKGNKRRGKVCKDPVKCTRRGGRRNKKVKSNETAKYVKVPKGMTTDGVRSSPFNWRNVQTKKTEVENHSQSCSSVPKKCDHICAEENGRLLCFCYSGFALVSGSKCVDINECRINNGGCEGKCVNTVGSRRCLCPEGFRVSAVDGKCIDINECLLRNGHGPCQDTCVNTRGGYYCSCEGLRGTVLSRDNHTCEEVNECISGAAGCSHSCISTFGRSFCTCPDGYELGDDWKTCRDIDECSEMEDECEYRCVNTIGSYYCEDTTLSVP